MVSARYPYAGFDVRKKFCDCYIPEPKEEAYQMAEAMHVIVDNEIMPRRQELDGGWHHDQAVADEAMKAVHRALIDFGLQRGILPESMGGMTLSTSMVQYSMLIEELARGDVAIATHYVVLGGTFLPMNMAKRTDMLERFGKKLLDDEQHTGCQAFTEPQGGVDIDDWTQHFQSIRTTATLDGDDYVINGSKIWPGGAGVSDTVYMTVATTDPALGDDGVICLYVPVDAPGLSFGTPIEKMGFCCTDVNAEIYYDNVRVPREYSATHNTDMKASEMFHALATRSRITSAARAVGVMQAVIEIVLDYTEHRTIAGKPMRERSLFLYLLGDMVTRMEVSRAMYLQTAYMVDQAGYYAKLAHPDMFSKASAAKSYASHNAVWVAEQAINLMGAYGYSHEYNVEKYLRDVKMVELWFGGYERTTMDVMLPFYPVAWA